MNYLSVCSGIECATVAWKDLGWKPLGFSEIETFPSDVLNYHYPDVKNYGDMTNYKEWKINEAVELVVGGTPCQSFSVAGLRKGLEDPRGNLALTFCGILDRFRPKWFIWENVPGVLSSNKGQDFGSFLGALVELGYGFSYRVLDAKNFGVPQRRRRVFVVGHLGDWRPSAKILFESESLRGDTKESRKTGESLARSITASLGNRQDATADNFITKAYSVREDAKANNFSATELEVSTALQAQRPSVQSHHAQTFIAKTKVYENHGTDSRIKEVDVSPTVTARWGTGGNNTPLVHEDFVRRLTPIECERLQGFPDNYTNIKENCPDSPRFKALGNSMAVPVMKWLGKRIQAYETE